MATLWKKGNNYYARICVRVGQNSLNKRKISYIPLGTSRYSFAKRRNLIVTQREHQIRADIRKGYCTKSDLLNINESTDWSWNNSNGKNTMEKLITINDYIEKFIQYKKVKKMREATIDSYRYALNKFSKSLGSNYLVSDINQENMDKFVDDLDTKYTLSLSSVDSNLKHISAYLNW